MAPLGFSFCAFVLITCSIMDGQAQQQWKDLKLTWGKWNQAPRSTRDPLFHTQKWTPVSTHCTNNDTFHGYQHIIPGEYGSALLFDANGVIAGIQILLNKSSLISPGNKVNYPELPVYQSQTIDDQDFFVLTTYFVDPAIICNTGRNDSDLVNQGTATQVIIQNGESPTGSLLPVPRNRTVALAEGWSKNQCFMSMGYHNFNGVEQSQDHNCTKVFPFFGLYDVDGDMVGFGSVHLGTVVNPRFEYPTKAAITAIIGPKQTPQCILDTEESIGLTSFHVYFIETPNLITCP